MAFAETFKALSDPVRRRILELLKNERLSAGEIGSHFDMTGATISYHLGILKKAGLVLEFREKNFIIMNSTLPSWKKSCSGFQSSKEALLMWKKYKTTLILTTLISLFPMVIGLLLWNRMPDTIATHFGTNNVPNGWSSKTMAVIGIPLFLAALQIFTAVLTFSDPKRQNIGPKMIRLVLWIIPITSLIVCCCIYANAVGIAVDIGFVSNGIVGLLFILIGNYMPKCKQNYTTGIKVPWTLHSQENWNRTHRLAGWIWIIGGVAMIVNSFLQLEWILFLTIAALVLIPIGYSFLLFKKGSKPGEFFIRKFNEVSCFKKASVLPFFRVGTEAFLFRDFYIYKEMIPIFILILLDADFSMIHQESVQNASVHRWKHSLRRCRG